MTVAMLSFPENPFLLSNTVGKLVEKVLHGSVFIHEVGLNQAFALFKGGIDNVRYHGIVGEDGSWMLEDLSALHNFPVNGIEVIKEPSGHCIIQIDEGDKGGDNAVILHYGANHQFTENKINEILRDAEEGDWLLVQGECNLLDYTIHHAKEEKKMKIFFNPAPYPPKATKEEWRLKYPCDWLIVNKMESEQIIHNNPLLHSDQCDPKVLVEAIKEMTGAKNVIHTRGVKGAYVLLEDGEMFHQPAIIVSKDLIKDTTGAGDAFAGYFVSSYLGYLDNLGFVKGKGNANVAIIVATHAAALSIQKEGALDSIPVATQVINSVQQNK